MLQNRRAVFSRCAEDSFEAIYFSTYMEECGCDVFSVTINRKGQYEIWGKYDYSSQLIDVDEKISNFLDHLPRKESNS